MNWSRPRWKATFSILLTWAVLFGVCVSPNSYVVRVDLEKREIVVRQLVGRILSKTDSKFLETG